MLFAEKTLHLMEHLTPEYFDREIVILQEEYSNENHDYQIWLNTLTHWNTELVSRGVSVTIKVPYGIDMDTLDTCVWYPNTISFLNFAWHFKTIFTLQKI